MLPPTVYTTTAAEKHTTQKVGKWVDNNIGGKGGSAWQKRGNGGW